MNKLMRWALLLCLLTGLYKALHGQKYEWVEGKGRVLLDAGQKPIIDVLQFTAKELAVTVECTSGLLSVVPMLDKEMSGQSTKTVLAMVHKRAYCRVPTAAEIRPKPIIAFDDDEQMRYLGIMPQQIRIEVHRK